MITFFIALFLTSAGTLMYEVVLTRLLSVVSWYYLAFISVSTAMFGMTAGALAVQLRPDLFNGPQIRRRLFQASFAMAVSMPLTLLTMLAVPIEIARSAQTLYSFVLFTAIISVPFFFSGIAVCLSLTRTPFPIGQVYFVDLIGAAAGCLGSVGLLKLLDAPSAMLTISSLLFLSAAGYASHAGESGRCRRSLGYGLTMLALAGLNGSTLYGIQPIWTKGSIDRRGDLLAEVWNPISKVRVFQPAHTPPLMWGPSPRMPAIDVDSILLDIDNSARTAIFRYRGDPKEFGFLRYDVTSLADQLRRGGTAAIIGMGGGRDVLAATANGFRRIVAIEVNGAIVDLVTRRLEGFSSLSKVPGLEVHTDEGRSYLTRTEENFDVIQASMVDTWAATSAGAMTLSENSLYTVEAWRIFYQHLKPGGLITFTRWYKGSEVAQTFRMFSLAWAALLAEGIPNPADHIALLGSGGVATLLVSNRPLEAEDIRNLQAAAKEMDFEVIFLPGRPTLVPELSKISTARTLDDLRRLRYADVLDYSPVFDSSPFFFNALRLRHVPEMARRVLGGGHPSGGSLRALIFLLCFMFAAIVLLAIAVLLPLTRWGRLHRSLDSTQARAIIYFTAIGLGFMLIEIAMMQQLSIFLGNPIYSLVVVLAGLICSTGLGSLVSEKLPLSSSWVCRAPAFAAAIIVLGYSAAVIPFTQQYASRILWQRATLSLALVVPCGFLMGFCFPVGLRWMNALKYRESLPWMWALNGAASVLASFIAVVISMETTIGVCVMTGVSCYVLAGMAMPQKTMARALN
jgi:spermidine synthase